MKKADIIARIEAEEEYVSELEEELKKKELKDAYHGAAKEIYGLFRAFIKAGFTEEQAFELTKATIKNIPATPCF